MLQTTDLSAVEFADIYITTRAIRNPISSLFSPKVFIRDLFSGDLTTILSRHKVSN